MIGPQVAAILAELGQVDPEVLALALGQGVGLKEFDRLPVQSGPDLSGALGGEGKPAVSAVPAVPVSQGGGSVVTKPEFLQRFGPTAESVRAMGLDPALVLAQAALESGWGRSMPGNALLGIKADRSWTGPTRTVRTKEVDASGKRVATVAAFRAYESPEASLLDWAKFLQANPRYAGVFGKRGEAAADAIAAAGYATDPQYARKLKAIMKGLSGERG